MPDTIFAVTVAVPGGQLFLVFATEEVMNCFVDEYLEDAVEGEDYLTKELPIVKHIDDLDTIRKSLAGGE